MEDEQLAELVQGRGSIWRSRAPRRRRRHSEGASPALGCRDHRERVHRLTVARLGEGLPEEGEEGSKPPATKSS
uniref:Uncharacterized protein n=1 Tax=Oryza nivara TaxID=4536 RepID=A0A0E0ICT6_ORYNI